MKNGCQMFGAPSLEVTNGWRVSKYGHRLCSDASCPNVGGGAAVFHGDACRAVPKDISVEKE
jgi:hypothetical protein